LTFELEYETMVLQRINNNLNEGEKNMREIWRKKIGSGYGVTAISMPVSGKIVSVDFKVDQLTVWFDFDKSDVDKPFKKGNVCVTRSGLEYDDDFTRHLATIIRGEKVIQVLSDEDNGCACTVAEPNDEVVITPVPKKTVAKVDAKNPVLKKKIVKGVCAVLGCTKKVHAKGMCRTCYDAVRRA